MSQRGARAPGAPGAPFVLLTASVSGSAAVVDVQLVFESLKEKMQIEANLKGRLEQLNLDEQDRKRGLEELKSDLEILAPDTPAYNEKQAKLEQRAVQLRAHGVLQCGKIRIRQT